MKIPLEITQLGELIKESMPNQVLRVVGEVSQPKNFRGNMYLNLKDKMYNIKAIIWKTKYEQFNTEIKDGDKIVVKGKLDFYGANGSVTYIIDKLIKYEGEGELSALYQKYKKTFETKGYFDRDKKLIIPDKIEKILLLTSESGAAIHDFIYALDNNHSKLDYDIIDVPVQGRQCPLNIINEINKIKDNYDAIVITRGGGSFEDLFGFSQPELIEAIHNFDQPVISAIGHQVDTSLLDLVSDCCCPTPSLAAQYIIDTNKKFINELEEIRDDIKDELLGSYNKQNRGLNNCTERLNKIILSFDRIQHSYQSELLNQLNTYAFKLKELDLKLSSLVNNATEKNNIILIKNNKNVIHKDVGKFIKRLEGTDDFIIDWGNKKIKISSYKFEIL
jgi:exodeoxyribonuclease VII large subunit